MSKLPLTGGGPSAGGERFDLYIDWKNGADANDGLTPATALKTLTHALTHIGVGQSIGVLGDAADNTTWFREYAMTCATNTVTIKAVSGHTPVFVASHEYTAWALTGGTANVYETAYVSASCWGVWNGTTRLTSVANVPACDALTNSRYFDNAGNMLYVNIGGAAPTSIEAYDVGNSYALTCSGTGITLDGLRWAYQMMPVHLTGANCVAQNSRCTEWVGYQLGAEFSMIWPDAAGILVDNCYLSGLRTTVGATYDSLYGVAFKTADNNCTVSNCEISFASCGINIKTVASTGHVFTRNTIYDCYDAIDGDVAGSSFTASYNTVINMGHGAMRITGAGSAMICHHNLSYMEAGTTRVGNYGFIVDPDADATLYHNTVDRTNAITPIACYFAQGAGSVTARNNIATHGALGFQSPGASTIVFDSDYNSSHGMSHLGGEFHEDWVAGAHDITDDPLYTNEAGDDYTLQAGSPCLNTGEFVAGYSELGPPTDMGRYES